MQYRKLGRTGQNQFLERLSPGFFCMICRVCDFGGPNLMKRLRAAYADAHVLSNLCAVFCGLEGTCTLERYSEIGYTHDRSNLRFAGCRLERMCVSVRALRILHAHDRSSLGFAGCRLEGSCAYDETLWKVSSHAASIGCMQSVRRQMGTGTMAVRGGAASHRMTMRPAHRRHDAMCRPHGPDVCSQSASGVQLQLSDKRSQTLQRR